MGHLAKQFEDLSLDPQNSIKSIVAMYAYNLRAGEEAETVAGDSLGLVSSLVKSSLCSVRDLTSKKKNGEE